MKYTQQIAHYSIGVLYIIIFAGALIYSAEQMSSYESLRELLFWAAIMFLLLKEFAWATRTIFKDFELLGENKK